MKKRMKFSLNFEFNIFEKIMKKNQVFPKLFPFYTFFRNLALKKLKFDKFFIFCKNLFR
jgi:hypothetical protein